MADYRRMWQELDLDLERHDAFLGAVPEIYADVFLSQADRPAGMAYFDGLMAEIHGGRVREIMEHKGRGGLVAGTFCVFVPDEIILAAGGVSVGLCAGTQFTVTSGEKILPRNICPLIKSALGFKLDRICPYFQAADMIIGETTCDGKKKTWEILNDYVPTWVMELPQRKEDADWQLWGREVGRLKEEVERKAGVTIDSAALAEAIEVTNARRRALQRLYATRKSAAVPISGKDALLVTQLAFFDDPRRFAENTNALCVELEERIVRGEGVFPADTPRLLIAGSPMPLPSWKFHHIVETSGAVVVCEETCTGTRYFESMVAEDGTTVEEHLANLARRVQGINCACFTPNEGRVKDILRLVREYKADGVIYYSLQFCQTYGIEAYKVERALNAAGIPVLRIESDFSDEDGAQIKTRIDAFLEMIKGA